MARAWMTQVEAFWSKSIQKKGMVGSRRALMRKTALAPSTASAGCSRVAPSSQCEPCPRWRSAEPTTLRKEWGLGPVGGTIT